MLCLCVLSLIVSLFVCMGESPKSLLIILLILIKSIGLLRFKIKACYVIFYGAILLMMKIINKTKTLFLLKTKCVKLVINLIIKQFKISLIRIIYKQLSELMKYSKMVINFIICNMLIMPCHNL
jgi:hypothetical protein